MDGQISAAYLRAKFGGMATCNWPYYGKGKAHPGHAKCLRFRKRQEADKRRLVAEVRKSELRKQEALQELTDHANKEASTNKRHRRRSHK